MNKALVVLGHIVFTMPIVIGVLFISCSLIIENWQTVLGVTLFIAWSLGCVIFLGNRFISNY